MTTAVASGAQHRDRSRRPLELAALGVAAVPEMRPVSVVSTRPTRDGVDTAVVRDSTGRDWVVTAPRRGDSGAEIEAEAAVLDVLRDRMPFVVPHPHGHAAQRRGGRVMVYPALQGEPVSLAAIGRRPALAAAVGAAIAAVHRVDPEALAPLGVPVYDGESLRRRCLIALDRGAEPGIVPPSLLSRWESRIEDVARWRFVPCPVHGELLADRVLVLSDEVAAVVDWSGARVSDPAEDLAWLAVGVDPAGLEVVLGAYHEARGASPDPHLVDRAILHGEMAVVRWLLHGLRVGDDDVVREAEVMLHQLATWHAEHDPPRTAGGDIRGDAPTADDAGRDAGDVGGDDILAADERGDILAADDGGDEVGSGEDSDESTDLGTVGDRTTDDPADPADPTDRGLPGDGRRVVVDLREPSGADAAAAAPGTDGPDGGAPDLTDLDTRDPDTRDPDTRDPDTRDPDTRDRAHHGTERSASAGGTTQGLAEDPDADADGVSTRDLTQAGAATASSGESGESVPTLTA